MFLKIEKDKIFSYTIYCLILLIALVRNFRIEYFFKYIKYFNYLIVVLVFLSFYLNLLIELKEYINENKLCFILLITFDFFI